MSNSGGSVVDSGNASDGGTGAGASTYYVNGGSLKVKGIFVTTNDTVEAQDGGKVRLASLQQDLHDDGVSLVQSTVPSPRSRSARPAARPAGRSRSTPPAASRNRARSMRRRSSTRVRWQSHATRRSMSRASSPASGSVTVDAGSSLYLYGATTKATNTMTFPGPAARSYCRQLRPAERHDAERLGNGREHRSARNT